MIESQKTIQDVNTTEIPASEIHENLESHVTKESQENEFNIIKSTTEVNLVTELIPPNEIMNAEDLVVIATPMTSDNEEKINKPVESYYTEYNSLDETNAISNAKTESETLLPYNSNVLNEEIEEVSSEDTVSVEVPQQLTSSLEQSNINEEGNSEETSIETVQSPIDEFTENIAGTSENLETYNILIPSSNLNEAQMQNEEIDLLPTQSSTLLEETSIPEMESNVETQTNDMEGATENVSSDESENEVSTTILEEPADSVSIYIISIFRISNMYVNILFVFIKATFKQKLIIGLSVFQFLRLCVCLNGLALSLTKSSLLKLKGQK